MVLVPREAVLVALGILVVSAYGSLDVSHKYHTFSLKVDHFKYGLNKTFQLRYALADQYWDANGGPIFIHTANEGAIEDHVRDVGIMWEWAEEFKALLVFPEHRYYGNSLPFGNDSFGNPENMAYLTTEQALADYATLLMWLKRTLKGARDSKIAAFGGGFAGMLATWLRIKYPYLITAVLASSAPFRLVTTDVPCYVYFQHVTKTYQVNSPGCPGQVRRIWPILKELNVTEEGRRTIHEQFKLCEPVNETNFPRFLEWVRDSLVGLAMINYPYASSQTPVYPVKVACGLLRDSQDKTDRTINAIAEAVGFFRNTTGNTECYAATSETEDIAWEYQKCTEFMHPTCGDGVSDMFERTSWHPGLFAAQCRERFGVSPPAHSPLGAMGGPKLCGTYRAFFSNGDLDPWAPYCLTEAPKPNTEFRTITGAAHSLDLRFQHSDTDPRALQRTRALAKAAFQRWLH